MCTRRGIAAVCVLAVLAGGVSIVFGQSIEAPVLTVTHQGLQWTPAAGAIAYDVMRGDLVALRQSGGDFRSATRSCLAEFYDLTDMPYAGVPKPGEAFWFLVRGVSDTEAGTFDSGGPGQVGTRDPEIEAAPAACFSPVVSHPPIVIASDSEFTPENGVTGGSGTPADPYIVSGWYIDCAGAETSGILIRDTTTPFVIRNVAPQSCREGILLRNTQHGRVERSRFYGSATGLRLLGGGDAAIEGNDFNSHADSSIEILGATNVLMTWNSVGFPPVGILLDGAAGCTVHHNNIAGSDADAIDRNGGLNLWDDLYPSGGNFWRSYAGADACTGSDQDDCVFGDGIGDTPHSLDLDIVDRYPRKTEASREGDTTPPTVVIAGPAEGSTVTAQPIGVHGTASDSPNGTAFLNRVEVRHNGGPWSIAGTGSPWSLWTDLVPGTNVIEARSFDHAGYVSRIDTRTVTYSESSDPAWNAVLSTSSASYAAGQPVPITFTMTNISSAPVTLSFPTTCQAFFLVEDVFGAVVYHHGIHLNCFFILTQRTWQPNQSAIYSFSWDQRDDAGQPVPAGASYRIRGFLDSFPAVPDDVRLIAIQPAPIP